MSNILSSDLKLCSDLLSAMLSKKHSAIATPFYKPVDVKKPGLHDYLIIIETPMDLGTIKAKMDKRSYNSPLEFAEDVRLVFRNCYTYNPPDNELVVMARKLEKIFEGEFSKIYREEKPRYNMQFENDTEVAVRISALKGQFSNLQRELSKFNGLYKTILKEETSEKYNKNLKKVTNCLTGKSVATGQSSSSASNVSENAEPHSAKVIKLATKQMKPLADKNASKTGTKLLNNSPAGCSPHAEEIFENPLPRRSARIRNYRMKVTQNDKISRKN